MKYIVEMNGAYMNSFNSYSEAKAFADELSRKFPTATITIVN